MSYGERVRLLEQEQYEKMLQRCQQNFKFQSDSSARSKFEAECFSQAQYHELVEKVRKGPKLDQKMLARPVGFLILLSGLLHLRQISLDYKKLAKRTKKWLSPDAGADYFVEELMLRFIRELDLVLTFIDHHSLCNNLTSVKSFNKNYIIKLLLLAKFNPAVTKFN